MNPTYDFSGQVAVVTGAGMGLDTARAFAAAGTAVVLADVNKQALRTATDELTAAGHPALGVTCDAADEPARSSPAPPALARRARRSRSNGAARLRLGRHDEVEVTAGCGSAHHATSGAVLILARTYVWTWRSTAGLEVPPPSSPHTTVTSAPSRASASSIIASETQPPRFTV
jgi:NAD(P)-dependent dehydrogenase (short-subunit alcohol dehydrogenase family)